MDQEHRRHGAFTRQSWKTLAIDIELQEFGLVSAERVYSRRLQDFAVVGTVAVY